MSSVSDTYSSQYSPSSPWGPRRARRVHAGVGQHTAHMASSRHEQGHGRAWGIALFCILIVLIIGAWWAAGHFYFADRAPMGTSFAGQSLAGQTRAQVENAVEKKAQTARVTFRVIGRPSATLSYEQLAVTPHVSATVAAIVNARGSNPFAKAWPFGSHTIPLSASLNDRAATDAVNARVLTDGEHMVEPTATYQPQSHAFVATPGKSGLSASQSQVHAAIMRSLEGSSSRSVSATVSIEKSSPSIPDASATALAAQANARLNTNYTISNGHTKAVRIPADVLASWMTIQPNAKSYQLELTVNREAADKWIQDTVPSKINVAPIDQHDMYSPHNTKIAVKSAGYNGLKVTSLDPVVTAVVNGLQSGQPVFTVAPMQTEKFTVIKDVVPHNFSVPNGDPWVHIDLSSQTLTTFKGTTKVASYPIATGKAGHDTPDGTFYVYLRYDTQTMRGPGYVSPGVRYINYFNGSVATHAAPWNVANINAGRASSHGCVNMLPQDALTVYKFAPLGTMVQVTGKAPASAAR